VRVLQGVWAVTGLLHVVRAGRCRPVVLSASACRLLRLLLEAELLVVVLVSGLLCARLVLGVDHVHGLLRCVCRRRRRVHRGLGRRCALPPLVGTAVDIPAVRGHPPLVALVVVALSVDLADVVAAAIRALELTLVGGVPAVPGQRIISCLLGRGGSRIRRGALASLILPLDHVGGGNNSLVLVAAAAAAAAAADVCPTQPRRSLGPAERAGA